MTETYFCLRFGKSRQGNWGLASFLPHNRLHPNSIREGEARVEVEQAADLRTAQAEVAETTDLLAVHAAFVHKEQAVSAVKALVISVASVGSG